MALTVRRIGSEQHLAWIQTRESVSFLQLPQWGRVKQGWRPESLGWFDGSTLVGTALVLFRPVPRVPRRSLAYLPEGPCIDWLQQELPGYRLEDWLHPMLGYCRQQGAFSVKMGPPVPLRRWQAPTIKGAIADLEADPDRGPRRLTDVVADWHSPRGIHLVERLLAHGWTQEPATGAGFGDVQPRFVFQVPLAGRSADEIFAGFNQLWRRNVRKAEANGVQVRLGSADDLPAFHQVYVETAIRERFTPRSVGYFQRMWEALNEDQPRLTLWLAEYQGHLAAATLMVQVQGHAWYSYGASTTADRDVRPSNALQWAMLQHAQRAGCQVYDLRGIANTIDPAEHLFGLVQFKVGTGGYAQELAGEFDMTLRPAWAWAFRLVKGRLG
ncbi:MAG: lipid II:glycine glycyltransferase FemX [Actinomycetales bacterium]